MSFHTKMIHAITLIHVYIITSLTYATVRVGWPTWLFNKMLGAVYVEYTLCPFVHIYFRVKRQRPCKAEFHHGDKSHYFRDNDGFFFFLRQVHLGFLKIYAKIKAHKFSGCCCCSHTLEVAQEHY